MLLVQLEEQLSPLEAMEAYQLYDSSAGKLLRLDTIQHV